MYLEATEIFERLGYFTSRITVSLFLLSLSLSLFLERKSRAVGVFFSKLRKSDDEFLSVFSFLFYRSDIDVYVEEMFFKVSPSNSRNRR